MPKSTQQTEAEETVVAQADAQQAQAEETDQEPTTEPGEGQNPINQETAAVEDRVVNQGEVSDPGNSGLVGQAFKNETPTPDGPVLPETVDTPEKPDESA